MKYNALHNKSNLTIAFFRGTVSSIDQSYHISNTVHKITKCNKSVFQTSSNPNGGESR